VALAEEWAVLLDMRRSSMAASRHLLALPKPLPKLMESFQNEIAAWNPQSEQVWTWSIATDLSSCAINMATEWLEGSCSEYPKNMKALCNVGVGFSSNGLISASLFAEKNSADSDNWLLVKS